MRIKAFFENIGPGPIIAAAFIGPGTVMVCTLAGFNFGFSLLWGLGLSIIATVILQEMAGRIGLVTGMDLSQLIRNEKGHPIWKLFQMLIILIAIVIGNAAYESGNITGSNLGLSTLWKAPVIHSGYFEFQTGNFILGALAFSLLWWGSYKVLERILVTLVILMSLAFLSSSILTSPDWGQVLKGFIPEWSPEKITTVVGLIGTTVVPYNLFLYASLAKNKWQKEEKIPIMRRDIILSVILGGIVSMAIVIVGSANTSTEISGAQDVASGLEMIFGSFAKYLMGIGLLAAGLTSSITAPLAGGLVICGIMGWNQETRSKAMRFSMGFIVLMGLIFSSFGIKPVQLISLAQLANGILLPVISGWIIWKASQKSLMKSHKNSGLLLTISILIWLITLALGLKGIGSVVGFNIF
ncbi:Nramp family divalent metal transporter [Algoriphagus sp. CAU 1675]|uniref:Nramp family divalent metal transporter n=1 Tax=Algoriphagus sp. CAU 1675 TaxID=3032597 RepID=UPI0023DAF8B7|nr:Nramp family divalent metal transporter [Algoriphagus sp. CAU 1675]MDF2158090.1 Nramp family divalent metal transporter [Algoriphagus sp. CAU 1675]